MNDILQMLNNNFPILIQFFIALLPVIFGIIFKFGHKVVLDENYLLEQIEKCQTAFQAGVFCAIYRFFPFAKVEVTFFDHENGLSWRVDIVIGNFWVELDGYQHRFDDGRFNLDEMKDTFGFRNGKYVFRRSNFWWQKNWKRFPQFLLEFLKKNSKFLKA